MKRLLALALTVITVFSLAGCGNNKTQSETTNAENSKRYITFGSYEQDNNTENGMEAIEWIVLAEKDGKLLLLSKYGLDCQQYHEIETDITWENCTLRTWLNNDFYNTAFTEEQKNVILETTLTNPDNSVAGIEGGNDTTDKIFLLSIDEAYEYFGEDSTDADGNKSNPDRAIVPTAYALAQGSVPASFGLWYDGNCPGWLRSPGYATIYAAIVDYNGTVYDFGHGVSHDKNVVRPALWINADSQNP